MIRSLWKVISSCGNYTGKNGSAAKGEHSVVDGKLSMLNQRAEVGKLKVLSSPAGKEMDDPMLGFLALISKVERPACSNCDAKDTSPMFFCNTCGQAICCNCKENTHSAKMFANHDITSVSPYSREVQRKCPMHHEVCIMFSPATESLLCINCFRDLGPDSRAQCLDLDTAYSQKCERLHKGLAVVSKLELEIKEEATSHRTLLKELHINAMREESTVHVFSKILQGAVTQTEEILIEAVKRELQSKEKVIEDKLRTLDTLQSNVQAYLSLSTAFISSASKYELLKLASGLAERLTAIGAIVQPTRVSAEGSSISSNFKSEFSHSLKQLLQQEVWIPPALATADPAADTNQQSSAAQQVVVDKPLPFLGRSQSLVNISLSLERANTPPILPVVVTKPCVTTTTIPATTTIIPSSVASADQTLKAARKSGAASQKSSSKRYSTLPWRSKSAERVPPLYDVSQVELFATIQSLKGRATKNVVVTSLVGMRQSDQCGGDRNSRSEHDPGRPHTLKNPPSSGHVCVVQAMVHKDADRSQQENVAGATTPGGTAGAADLMRNKRPRSNKAQQWPYENGSRKSASHQLDAQSSIELTPEQARDLLKAISAAQRTSQRSDHWSGPVKECKTDAKDAKRIVAQRRDSFEGHEDAVRMLVDAVKELRQICFDKGTCEHN